MDTNAIPYPARDDAQSIIWRLGLQVSRFLPPATVRVLIPILTTDIATDLQSPTIRKRHNRHLERVQDYELLSQHGQDRARQCIPILRYELAAPREC